MFFDIKKTIKQTAIYSFGNLSSKLVGFLLLPLYTDYLLPDEYGILAILQAILQILIGVFGFNLPTAMMRWHSSENNEDKKRSIIFTTFIATTIVAIALSIFLLPFSGSISLYWFSTEQFSTYFVYLFLASSAGIISNVPLNVIRLKEMPGFYVVISTIRFLAIILMNIYFVAYAKTGVEGIMISEFWGAIIVIVISFPVIIKDSKYEINLKILKEMFIFGFPLVFSTLFSFVLTLGDRFVIEYFEGTANVGVYSLGHKIASIINMLVVQSFQLGFLPLAYKKLGSPNDKRYFSKILTYYTALLAFSVLSISLFGKEFIELFVNNKDYWFASSVIPIVALAFLVRGIQYNFSLSFHFEKKTNYVTLIIFITSAINVFLSIFLVKIIGFIGAAYSLLISSILMMIISYYYGQKIFQINYELIKMTKILALSFALYFISFLFQNSGLIINIIIKSILIISFPFIIYKLSIFDEVEIKSLKRGINDFLNRIK